MGFGSSKNSSTQQSTSASTSSSLNQAYPQLNATFSPTTALTGTSTNAISSLLGLNGESGQNAAFDNFRNSSGYNFVQDQGVKGIEGNYAAKGLLGSGSALKAITSYSSNLANSFLSNYLSNLTGLSNTGIQAGQVIAGAGNTANSQSNSVSTGNSSGSSTNLSLK